VDRYETNIAEQQRRVDQIHTDLTQLKEQYESITIQMATILEGKNHVIHNESKGYVDAGEHALSGAAGRFERSGDQWPTPPSAGVNHLVVNPGPARSWDPSARPRALPSPPTLAALQIARKLEDTRRRAMLSQQEQTLAIDVENRLFETDADNNKVQMDPSIELSLDTLRSETIGEHIGRIRFFPDGRSTGGRIQLQHGGERATVDIDWLTGAATVQVLRN
jgi:hypothetical protein